jgi:cytochrome d ubiquinol oxidase subunit II
VHRDPTTLQTLWFILICVLWIGYFVLEGFDFGVGMLIRHVARDDIERRMVLHSIGPVWDGNEVWLLVAGGATFAAFPGWYATLFSGAYLALFLVLFALIARGVSFEFWGKDPRRSWRSTWEWALVVGSFVPALLWGVAWADNVRGLPLNASHDMTGNLFDLLVPYALSGGAATLLLFLSHGAIYLQLRTEGEVSERAAAVVRWAAPAAAVAVTAFLAWTIGRQANGAGVQGWSLACAIVAVALVGAVPLLFARRPGYGFALSAAGIAFMFIALFVDLFPNAVPSTTSPANTLTLSQAASSPYTLKVMTVVAVVMVPVVLAYQAWSYWVFRARLTRQDFERVTPLDLLDAKR